MPGCHGLIAGGGGPTLGLGYGRPVSLLRLHGLRQRVPLQRPCSASQRSALQRIAAHCIALHCKPLKQDPNGAQPRARARAHPHSARRQAAQHAQMRRTRRRRQPIAAALAVRGSPEATGLPASWNERYDAYCSCERRRWDSYLRCTTAEAAHTGGTDMMDEGTTNSRDKTRVLRVSSRDKTRERRERILRIQCASQWATDCRIRCAMRRHRRALVPHSAPGWTGARTRSCRALCRHGSAPFRTTRPPFSAPSQAALEA